MKIKNKSNYLQNLQDTLDILDDSLYWLRRSYKKSKVINIKDQYSDDEFDVYEALCSRYARSCDILINKVFRSLDYVELENPGTIIDIVNRAHKRGFFAEVDSVRLLKDLRNQIVHEYVRTELIQLFSTVYKLSSTIFEISDQVKKYINEKNYLNTNIK